MNSTEIENATKHIYEMDKRLSRIIDLAGKCMLTPERNFYNALVRSIINQQLSTKAAANIYNRFMQYFNNKPQPQNILKTKNEKLRKLGLSYAKIKYIKNLSLKVNNNEIDILSMGRKTDNEIIAELIEIKGIGYWTVHMFLIFTLNRLNVLPVHDLSIKKAIKKVYGLKKLPDEKKIVFISKKNGWDPYNSIACWYLWKSLEL